MTRRYNISQKLDSLHSSIHVRFAIVQGMTIFAEINQKTMKKILLLLAAFLVLFACKKDGPQEVEPVTDDIDDVTYKVICPKCNAIYFVTCTDPEGDWGKPQHSVSEGGTDWASHSTPTLHWEVKNEAGNNVTFMEYWPEEKIKFNCQTQGCKGVMECKRDDFKLPAPDDSVIPIIR